MIWLTLIVVALGVALTRFIPFVLIKDKELPQSLNFLLDGLPYATISLLLVYAFKDVDKSNALPTILASTVCAGLYLWKKNTILSIVLSTAIYMVMIQYA